MYRMNDDRQGGRQAVGRGFGNKRLTNVFNYVRDLCDLPWDKSKVLNKDILWEATHNKSHLFKEFVHTKMTRN